MPIHYMRHSLSRITLIIIGQVNVTIKNRNYPEISRKLFHREEKKTNTQAAKVYFTNQCKNQ